MLTEIYIEAFDEELADQVWEAWDAGEVDDQSAYIAWWLIVFAQIRAKPFSALSYMTIFLTIFDQK